MGAERAPHENLHVLSDGRGGAADEDEKGKRKILGDRCNFGMAGEAGS